MSAEAEELFSHGLLSMTVFPWNPPFTPRRNERLRRVGQRPLSARTDCDLRLPGIRIYVGDGKVLHYAG